MKINLVRYCSRYLCGDESLKSWRDVNRRRYSLAFAGAHINDENAHALSTQSKKFIQSINNIRNTTLITQNELCRTNSILAENNKLCGKIRDFQNWVGKSIKEAIYLPPPHENIPHLLNDFLTELNSKKDKLSLNELINIYSQLLLIHPFADGNGRTARTLWIGLWPGDISQYLPHLMYRFLVKNKSAHDEAVRSLLKNDLNSSFWNEMIFWTKEKQDALDKINKNVSRYINSKLALINTTQRQIDFIQNIVNDSVRVINSKDIHSAENSTAIELFCNNSFLNIKGVNRWSEQYVIDCEFINESHEEIEKLIFS